MWTIQDSYGHVFQAEYETLEDAIASVKEAMLDQFGVEVNKVEVFSDTQEVRGPVYTIRTT